MEQLIFVTGNEGKAIEAQRILGAAIKRVKVPIDEIQGVDLRTLVEYKVKQAYAKVNTSASLPASGGAKGGQGGGQAVIVDDVSFAIKQLNGLPGPLIRWFEDGIGSQGVADMLTKPDRSVTWIVAYGFYDGKTFFYAEGVTQGSVAKKVRGKEGFGFDTIFIPKGYTKTTAELGLETKIKIGSRTKALKKLKAFLKSYAE